MSITPKTAIITRTKNRPILFERALKSAVGQTSKDYIHVILNDGGDKTIVEDILKKYPDKNRIVIHNEKSVGLTRALNQAIKSVDTEYISILDDDDTWHPDRIKEVSLYLDKHGDEPGVAVGMERIIEEIQGKSIVEKSRNIWYEGVTEILLYDQLLDNYLTNNCITYRRSLYDELNGYDESLEAAEDWDFGIRYLLRYDISIMPKILAYYHHRPADLTINGNAVFAGIETQDKNLVKLRNRYLRSDIDKGVFGIGYIMNDLHSSQLQKSANQGADIHNVVRLESHINYATDKIASEIEDVLSHNVVEKRLHRKIKGVIGRLKGD